MTEYKRRFHTKRQPCLFVLSLPSQSSPSSIPIALMSPWLAVSSPDMMMSPFWETLVAAVGHWGGFTGMDE